MTFDDGKVTNIIRDMNNPNAARRAVGTYDLSGNYLVILMDNTKYSYILKWYGQNQFTLSNNLATLIYSQSKTAEDTYLSNYIQAHGNPYGSGYNKPTTSKREICYTCRGTGRCKVCGGVGSYSNTYTSGRSLCNACSSTGKCWHCYGSGYQ
jgi:hypothetical protein